MGSSVDCHTKFLNFCKTYEYEEVVAYLFAASIVDPTLAISNNRCALNHYADVRGSSRGLKSSELRLFVQRPIQTNNQEYVEMLDVFHERANKTECISI